MNPSELTLDDALALPVPLTWAQQAARDMDNGLMLGRTSPDGSITDFRYYIGPDVNPPGRDESTLIQRMKADAKAERDRALLRSFVPAENMISGVVDNVIAHVGGSETTWTSTAKSEKLRLEAEAILAAVHASRNLHDLMQAFTRPLAREGVSVIRVRVPTGATLNGRVRSADMLTIASKLLRIEVAPAEACAVGEDEDTLTPYGVFSYTRNSERCAEVSFINASGQTVIRQMRPSTPPVDTVVNLGGRVPLISSTGRATVTWSMLRNQMSANSTTTNISRNTDLAGWLERWMHNMEQQVDAEGRPIPIITGPGGIIATRSLMVEQVDGDEVTGLTPRGKSEYQKLDPISAEPLGYALETARRNIYAEAHQTHYLMSADGSVGAESRKTAMQSFGSSLGGLRSDYSRSFRELLELILAMVSALAGKPGYFESVAIEPVLTDTLVEATPESRMADRLDVQAGIISTQTARARQRVLNSTAEDTQIAAERAAAPPPTSAQV